ncbi:MAG TPA: energy transducer TonB [Allosphingosinicella sp.]|nr:energy transducer TonB [Allosphingosinicella sp.]
MTSALALALAAVAPAPEATVEPGLNLRDIPAGRWVADRSDGCAVLRRTAGSPAQTVAVQLGPGSGLVRILVLNAGWNRAAVRNRRRVELAFGGVPVSTHDWTSGIESAGEFGFSFTMLDSSVLDRLAALESLTVSERERSLLELKLPSARLAAKVLRDCEEAALRNWGVDVEARARLQRQARPVKPLATLIRYQDYPAAELRKGISGRVTARLAVGKDGRISTCTIVASSDNAALDRQTCALLSARARFEPALGPDGLPAEGIHIARVAWAAPRH